MRIATWNVNSLRSRIDRVEAFLQRHDVDVLAVQETKAREDQLPLMGLTVLGYDIAAAGYDQWNGVAIISRVGIEDVEVGFPDMPTWGEPAAAEARAIGASCGGVRIWSLYVPNGRKVDDPHYVYKLDWLAHLRTAARSMTGDVALVGDWNIAPEDEDVFDIQAFAKSTHVTPPERAAFNGFLEDGYVDVVRPHAPGPEVYTYWDYYRQRYERNRGMRIDFVLGNPSLAARVTGASIDHAERAGKGASDHAPVIVDLADWAGGPARWLFGADRPPDHRLHDCVGPGCHAPGMDTALPLLTLVIGVLLGAVAVLAWSRRAGDPEMLRALTARGEDQAVLRDGLDRLHERLMDVEQQRASWQGQLRQQVDDMRHSTDLLRRETGALSTALRKPHVRGQWGELHLRKAVELAGMVERCDFEEQVHLAGEDGNLRPDLVVRLAGGRSVVVDAKVPLDAQLDALATDDPEEVAAHLRRHVRQVRSHVDTLSGKAYWRSLPVTPEFVVMFVPAESFLAAALDTDPSLLAYAATKDVVIATPTTLIALLRTIAHGWTTEALAERTREIHELGRELHTRIGVMGGHLDKVGRSLKGAVEAFNSAVGSIESRVLVTARQFEDIGVTREALAAVQPVEQTPRPLTAAELLDAVAEQRPDLHELPEGGSGESRRSSA